jgi:hypothetical protein
MEHGSKSVRFAKSLIHNYSKFDTIIQEYVLIFKEIPEHEMLELCSLILCESEFAAMEAVSPDNPEYERTMRPALIKLMGNSFCKDTASDFLEVWVEGIAKYLLPTLEDLLDKQLEIFNLQGM